MAESWLKRLKGQYNFGPYIGAEEDPALDFSRPEDALKKAVLDAVSQKYSQPAANDHSALKQQFLDESVVKPVGEPQVELPEAPEMREARIAESAMPRDQVMVPPPTRNTANQNKTQEQLAMEANIARGYPADLVTKGSPAAPPTPETAAGAGKGLRTAIPRAEVEVGEITMEPTPVKAKRANPLKDAFAKNELAMAFEKAGQKPEEALGEEFGPEYRQDALNSPNEPQVPVDPRKGVVLNQEQEQPKDKRPYWAALQGVIENAWKMGGQEAPKAGYYQTQLAMGDEAAKFGEAQKDREAKAASEQAGREFTHGENEANRGVTREHNAATEEATRAQLAATEQNRAMLDEDRDASRDQRAFDAEQNRQNSRGNTIIIQQGQDRRAEEKATQKFLQDLPNDSTVNALRDIMGRIDDPTEIGGWDAGKSWDKMAKIPIVGGLAEGFGNSARRGTEAEGLKQRAVAVMQQISLDTSGKALNEVEIRNIEQRLGMALGQSQQAFRDAMRQEFSNQADKLRRHYSGQAPGVQKRIQERGLLPDITPRPGVNMGGAPGAGSAGARVRETLSNAASMISPDLEAWLIERFGKVPKDYQSKMGVYQAKAMEDPDFRALVRKNEGID